MSDTNLPNEDDVLQRMLNTPPKPHKPTNGKRGDKAGTGKACGDQKGNG